MNGGYWAVSAQEAPVINGPFISEFDALSHLSGPGVILIQYTSGEMAPVSAVGKHGLVEYQERGD
jgi:hypothetical protein